jgi:hypothetical protein
MPSPFPGMDPYLEDENLWPVFQHHLVTCLYQILLPGLGDRYRARVGQRRYATEQPLFTSILRLDHSEELIEIRHRSDGRLITLIDVVSPTNKTTDPGRQAYLDKRRDARAAGANLVEIDLVLQGRQMLDCSREGQCDFVVDYAITALRASQPSHYEMWAGNLQRVLPSRCKLPLARDDRDVVVDLQTTFARTFDQGGFAGNIDYAKDPPTVLSEDNRTWLDGFLKQLKLR